MSSHKLTKLSKYIPLHRRWIPKYPLYTKGDPQLRIYLPLFWMKMVKPKEDHKLAADTVLFEAHPQMTKFDIKNYLEKIYKVPVMEVKTLNKRGEEMKDLKTGANLGYKPDKKMAYITLADGHIFEFPNIRPEPEGDKAEDSPEMKEYKKMEEEEKATHKKYWDKADIPVWFR